MVVFGMQNMNNFVETPGVFAHLQHFLDMDMGLVLSMEILPNFGQREVNDAPPPSLTLEVDELEPEIDQET